MELKQSHGTGGQEIKLGAFALGVRVVVQCGELREQGEFSLQRMDHWMFSQSKIGALRYCLHSGQAVPHGSDA